MAPDLQIQFARTPADALQCRVDAIRVRDALAMDSRESAEERETSRWMAAQLRASELLLWSKETTDLVSARSNGFPLDRMEIPATHASVLSVFPRGTMQAMTTNGMGDISSLAWQFGRRSDDGRPCLVLCPMLWMGNAALGDPGVVGFDDAHHLNSWFVPLIRWACTAAAFIEEEIIVADRSVVGKATRHRAERADVSPDVRVLRIGERRETTTSREVAWNWSWWVRSHDRRVLNVRTQEYDVIRIPSYIKGPLDKPIKPQRDVVYAVTR